MDSYISQYEKDRLKAFVDDEVLVEALKKVLMSGVYNQGLMRQNDPAKAKMNFALALANNPDLDDKRLGEELRAVYRGVALVETGFEELLSLKEAPKPEKAKENPAL